MEDLLEKEFNEDGLLYNLFFDFYSNLFLVFNKLGDLESILFDILLTFTEEEFGAIPLVLVDSLYKK